VAAHEWRQQFADGLHSSVFAAIEAPAVKELATSLSQLPEFRFETLQKLETMASRGLLSDSQARKLLSGPEVLLYDRIFSLPAVERRTALRLAAGADPEQIRLYADFLHCVAGNLPHESIERYISQARQRNGITNIAVPNLDEAELFSYFTRQSLVNLLALYQYLDRAQPPPADAAEALGLVAEFLDDTPALRPYFPLATDPTPAVLATLTPRIITQLGLGAPAWQRMTALERYQPLHNLVRTTNGWLIFLGNRQLHALAFDGQRCQSIPLAAAAAALRHPLSTEFRQHEANPIVSVLSVLPTETGHWILFPDGIELAISHQDFSLLHLGITPPPRHPLSVAMGRCQPVVAFANPFAAKWTTAAADADEVALAFTRAFPSHTFFRGKQSSATDPDLTQLLTVPFQGPQDFTVIVDKDNLSAATQSAVDRFASQHAVIKRYTGIESFGTPTNKVTCLATEFTGEMADKWLRKLGEAGAFKHQVVFIPRSPAILHPRMLQEMIGRYGALATYSPASTTSTNTLAEFINDMSGSDTHSGPTNLVEYLQRKSRQAKHPRIFTLGQ
jgi:hypothetical protein